MYNTYQLFEDTFNNNKSQVQLCQSNLNNFLEKTSENNIFWSPKIDGVRCWAIVNKRTIPQKGGFRKIGYVTYLSRNNKEFINFRKFSKDLISAAHIINHKFKIKYPIIIDSEVSTTNQNLSSTMTQLRRIKNMNPDLFILNIFDLAVENIKFQKRHDILENVFDNKNYKDIRLIDYRKLKDVSKSYIHQLKDMMIDKYKYEGIILVDGNSYYNFGGRSKHCVKLKREHTLDLEIIDVELGKPNSKWEGVVSKLICVFDDKKIPVSGRVNYKQRKEWAKNPPIGFKAEIKYSEITSNGRLREPVFIRLREDK